MNNTIIFRKNIYRGVYFMKRLVLFTGIILFSCVFISFFVTPVSAQLDYQDGVYSANSNYEETVYVLKVSGDKLVVFVKGRTEPVLTTETIVSVLPKEDQIALKNGVEVKGEKALREAIEDYCS